MGRKIERNANKSVNQKMKKEHFLLVLFFTFSLLFAQKTSKIEVEYSDFADVNQIELPDALLLTGNVRVSHDGIIMTCNKAYYYQKENYIKAFGDVEMIQGDTLTMTSKYAEYNGAIKKLMLQEMWLWILQNLP